MSESRFERYKRRAQQFGARTVLFQHAAAGRLDLTPTELETFRLVQHEQGVTASELAKQTGLKPGSMSVIIDKLVARGFLTREQDPNDRRRWPLMAVPEAIEQVDAIYIAHAQRVDKVLAAYSETDFDVILEFLRVFANELKITAIELGRSGDSPIDQWDEQDPRQD
ncbi:MAG: MarR family transcriptional regulator [Phycisphaerales bacterium]|nr:MarR family transcriptional regulator [Hyphomonadaceae bacterium]